MKMLSSLILMGIAATALAGSPPTGSGLIEKLAEGGMTEVEAGKLALAKSTVAAVKEFAEMMVKDHGAANEKVKALAAARNLTLPKTPSDMQLETLKTLRQKTSPEFEQTYLAAQVKAHEETVAMLKSEIANGQDSETKALARELLPTVETHLKEAYRLAGKEERAAQLPSG